MATLVQNCQYKDLLVIYLIVDLIREFLHSCLADAVLKGFSRERVENNMLELILNPLEEILAEPRALRFEISFRTPEVKLHRWIESDPSQSMPASNSSREIGLVLPSL